MNKLKIQNNLRTFHKMLLDFTANTLSFYLNDINDCLVGFL